MISLPLGTLYQFHLLTNFLSIFITVLQKKKIIIIQMQLDIVDGEDEGIIDNIPQILKHRSRNARYTLHKNFNKFVSIEDAKANKPNFNNPTQDNWEALCTY